MLNHQLILTDAKGRLRCTTADPDPDTFNGGTPTKDGLLCIADKDADTFLSGLGYVIAQNICTEQRDSGNMVSPTGRFMVSIAEELDPGIPPPEFWWAGLPFDHKGALCLAHPEDLLFVHPTSPSKE